MNDINAIGVYTSGGDSPGMNANVRAVVKTAVSFNIPVYGIYKGYRGMIDNHIEELHKNNVMNILQRGGTFLQTARSNEFLKPEGRAQAYENLQKHGIDALVCCGGDGSFHGLHLLIKETGIRGVGTPGTIDNDLYGTDYTIGYDTAINTALDAIDRIRDTASSHDRLFIVEVMGRHAGFIAQAVGLAGGAEDILIPETWTDIPEICKALQKAKDSGKHSTVLVVAEGDEAGGAFDIKRKIEKEAGWDVRVSVLGHIQRGGSPTASDRILATRCGYHAVQSLRTGETDVMIGIQNDAVTLTPLPDTWKKHKRVNPLLEDLIKVLR